jgi:hypothetical protein
MLIGGAAGGAIHLFAELIDNALRYSPPSTFARISAARGGDGGVVLRIADAGLGMNDADRRMANMRLQAGGEVTPDNARHMGLFVVGRIAARHGIRVGLRGPAPEESGSGTTAEIYLPPAVLEGFHGGPAEVSAAPRERIRAVSSPSAKLGSSIAATGRRVNAPPRRQPTTDFPAPTTLHRSRCCRGAARAPAGSPRFPPRPLRSSQPDAGASWPRPGGRTRTNNRQSRRRKPQPRRRKPQPRRRKLRRGRCRTLRHSSPRARGGPAIRQPPGPPPRPPALTPAHRRTM